MRSGGINDATSSRARSTRDGDGVGEPLPPVSSPPTGPAANRGQPAPLGHAPTAPSALRSNDNKRFAHNNTASAFTPLTQRSQTGGSTPLHSFVAVSTRLASGVATPAAVAPSRSVLGRVALAIRSIAGVPSHVQWLQQTMRTLRCSALRVHLPTQLPQPPDVTLYLAAGRGGEAVTRFWSQHEERADLSAAHRSLTAQAAHIGKEQPPHVGLGLSLAVLAVVEDDTHATSVAPQALKLLQGEDALVHLLSADPPAAADAQNADEVRVAVAMLRHIARSNQFDTLAATLVPALQPEQLAPLRRFIEADAAVAALADRAEPHTTRDMALRVRSGARSELQAGVNGLTAKQTVESFLWDNQFRDDGPKSDLAVLRQHFSTAIRELGREPSTGGVLTAAYRFGLAGADRHLLVDEAKRLTGLRDSEALDAVVGQLGGALRARLANAPPVPAGTPTPTLIARTIAQLVALQAWAPGSKETLTLEEMIRGREFAHTLDVDLRNRIEAACAEYAPDLESGQRADASRAENPQALSAKVQSELSLMRIGFEDFERLASELNVSFDDAARQLIDNAKTCIYAHTRMPGEKTPEAVGQMVGDFLEGVYFGNHIRLSHVSSGGISAGGLGFNATSLLNSGALVDASIAVVPRLQTSRERGREQVFRAGAATHGVEIFLGRELQVRESNGAGVLAGYLNDPSVPRLGISVDLRAGGYDRNSLDGVMLRIDRKIEEDGLDAQGAQVFRQSDPAVRQTAGGVARLLFQRASAARSEQDRQQVLDDVIHQFHGQGLSMTLMRQQVSRQRRDLTVGGGASYSVSLGAGLTGLRVGASVSAGVEYGHHADTAQRDATGSYKVNNLRTGWYTRRTIAGGADANAYVGAFGLPPTPLLRGAVTQNEGGATVRVRLPTRQGRIVPEKTFSDTETADPQLFKEIVLAEKQKWVELFAYQHRNEPDPTARGEQALNDLFHMIEAVRSGNHVYYARERLHPDVGQRLDELASLEALAPLSMNDLRAEVARQRSALIADDRSWGAASLIAYEKNTVLQGAAVSVGGAQGRHLSAVEGEREVIFQTPGWADLRARERAHQPGSLSDLTTFPL